MAGWRVAPIRVAKVSRVENEKVSRVENETASHRRHAASTGGGTTLSGRSLVVVGAGVFGLWQAVVLASRGARVRLVERSAVAFADAASRYGGAMLSPFCEAEAATAELVDLGMEGLAAWQATVPGVVQRGTLVIAPPRDRAELQRFARMTVRHTSLDGHGLAKLEPGLAGRFPTALYFAEEAHLDPRAGLAFLLDRARSLGVDVAFGEDWSPGSVEPGETIVDCRGLGARADLRQLRGVRGERLIVRSREVKLSRMIRLLHPRHPLYVVPWPDDLYMIGATMIESEQQGAVTVRSALDLMSAAYAVHPAFGEAEIVEFGAGVRPALPDNMPRAVVRGPHILVNGAYRHGYLLAPVLARTVADYLQSGDIDRRLMDIEATPVAAC